jgi:DNA-binding winged helix-turn-helix (wHTH) protein
MRPRRRFYVLATLLLALLETGGSLVSKEQLLAPVWPGLAVGECTVKVHVCVLRKALGEDRDYIRTEFGRGYRFIATVHSTVDCSRREHPLHWRHGVNSGVASSTDQAATAAWSAG